MGYEAMGAVHAWVARAWARARDRHGSLTRGRHGSLTRGRHGSLTRGRHGSLQRGQGTVEYVGLILLVAVILAGVVKASGSFSDKGIADAVVKKLKEAIDGVGR